MVQLKFLTIITLIVCLDKIAVGSDSKINFNDNKFISRLYKNRDLEELINSIVNHLIILKKVNCIAIVCDTNFLNVFNGQWFKRVKSIPIIMVAVDESEDLLSPNYDTLESFRQVRKEGCKLYIIIIANGIQASRLLIFGDRYRLIDTRANFIMLHDLRLFSPNLHYIWKRIINVIFIQRHQTKIIKNVTSCFELTTVPFPFTPKDVLIPKRLQLWKTNSVFKPINLFPDRALDLKGHEINVVAFQHVPAIVKVENSRGKNILFNGMEMEISRAFASVMNFKLHVYEPMNANVEKWGKKQLNGSYTGLLGEMVVGKADIALGNLHYTPYNLQMTDLSIPYLSQCLTFLTPESMSDNSWKTLILPFKLYMWIAVLLVLLVSGFIFYLLALFHRKLLNKSVTKSEGYNLRSSKFNSPQRPTGLYLFEEFTNSVLYTYGMLLVVSLPRLPTGWSIRLLTGWYWLYCVLVVTSYRASMTAILANPAPRVTIDTMDQLVDSSITCGGWGEETKKFFTSSLDEIGQKIGKKFQTINNPIKAVDRIIKGELAYYDNVYFLKYLMARQELDKNDKIDKMTNDQHANKSFNQKESTAERNLHIMKECAIHMPTSIGLEKNSPLKVRIDKLLRKMIEAGLVEKWLNDIMVPIHSTIKMDQENIKAEINLKKLYAGFVALGIGYGASLLVLIGELIHWKYVVLRDPKFDIYARHNYFKENK